MSEAELMQGVFSSIQVVISLFSTFFAMISAYIAGLYFFLNRAPVALKLLAFFLLSIGLIPSRVIVDSCCGPAIPNGANS